MMRQGNSEKLAPWREEFANVTARKEYIIRASVIIHKNCVNVCVCWQLSAKATAQTYTKPRAGQTVLLVQLPDTGCGLAHTAFPKKHKKPKAFLDKDFSKSSSSCQHHVVSSCLEREQYVFQAHTASSQVLPASLACINELLTSASISSRCHCCNLFLF